MTWTKLFGTVFDHANDGDVSPTIDSTGVTLMVAFGGQNGPFLDNFGNYFAPVAHGTRGGVDLNAYVCVLPTVGTGHVFQTFSNGTLEVYGWTGGVRPVDQLASAVGGLRTVTVGPLTPSADNEIILAGFGINNTGPGAPFSIDSGFTILETQDTVPGSSFGSIVAALIQTVAGAVTPTLTRSTNDSGGDIATLLSLKAAPGQTPSIVSHTSIAGAGAATSPSINTTGATVLVASLTQFVGQTTGIQQGITDSQGNRWLPVGPPKFAAANNLSTRWLICWNPSTSATHTFTIPGVNGSACFVALNNVLVADPINVIGAPTTSGSGTTVPAGTITPTVNGALVMAGWEMGDPNASSSPAYTVNNGFTLDEFEDVVSGSTWGSAAAWIIQAVAAAISVTLTRTNSGTTGTDQGVMIAFTPDVILTIDVLAPRLPPAMRPGAHGLSGRIAMAMRALRRATPGGSTTPVSSGNTSATENTAPIAATRASTDENVTPASTTATSADENSQRAAATANASEEATARIAGTIATPDENLGRVATSPATADENLAPAKTTAASAEENTQRAAATATTRDENVQRAASTIASPDETLGHVADAGTSGVSPWEALGLSVTAVSNSVVAAMEWLGRVAGSRSASDETLSPARSASTAPQESLGRAAAVGIAPDETLGAIKQTAIAPTERLGAVRASTTSPASWLGRVAGVIASAWEALFNPGAIPGILDEPIELAMPPIDHELVLVDVSHHLQFLSTEGGSPMSTIRLVQGEVKTIAMQFLGPAPAPGAARPAQSLAGATSLTVTAWNARVPTATPIISAKTLDVVDAGAGQASYRNLPGESAAAGRYRFEARAAFGDGTIIKAAGVLLIDPSPTE